MMERQMYTYWCLQWKNIFTKFTVINLKKINLILNSFIRCITQLELLFHIIKADVNCWCFIQEFGTITNITQIDSQ